MINLLNKLFINSKNLRKEWVLCFLFAIGFIVACEGALEEGNPFGPSNSKIVINPSSPKINKGTFYIADFPWYSTKKWANTIQNILNSKEIITAPFWLLKLLAIGGDIIKIIFKFDPPLTTLRLSNMMTGGSYPMDNTKEVVGKLPYDLNESVYITSEWMYEKKMIKHKPKRI